MGIRPSADLRTSSHWLFQDYHRVARQLPPRHRHRRIHLFHWNQQIREVMRKLQTSVAKELPETAAGNVFPNGWRTSQRTSRSQKYLHPQKFLMTQIRNVLEKWHHGCTVFFFTHFPRDPHCEDGLETESGIPCIPAAVSWLAEWLRSPENKGIARSCTKV